MAARPKARENVTMEGGAESSSQNPRKLLSDQKDKLPYGPTYTEMKTTVVWSCLPFMRSGQNHVVRHSDSRERGKKTRQAEEDVGRQRYGMDRPGVR